MLQYIREQFYFYPHKCSISDRHLHISPENDFRLYIDNNTTLYGYISKPINKISKYNKIIIYYHGNAGNIYDRIPFFNNMIKVLGRQYIIICMDYRGYGASTGFPSVNNLLSDGYTIAQHIKSTLPHNQIYYYGESIGSSIAAYVATKIPCSGIILKSPFNSMATLVSDLYNIPQFITNFIIDNDFTTTKWLNMSNLHNSKHLILYNENDTLIPFANIQELIHKYNSIKLSGNHNDCELNDTWKHAIYMITEYS